MYATLAVSLALALLVAGCNERVAVPVQENAASPGPAVPNPASDKWIGKWNGPEGTFLYLADGKGKYEVTIRNLDGPRTFPGNAVSAGIEFKRDGRKEVIRATNGVETGMKWLAGKSNCLTVRKGEGYCKD
jgi:hypothetical protein